MTANGKTCCAPERGGTAAVQSAEISARSGAYPDAIVDIPGGIGLIGCAVEEIAGDGEAPIRKKAVRPFRMGATTVTNAAFAAFVEASGYKTEAERFGWSFVFWEQVPEAIGPTQAVTGVEWWRRVDGANWREVNGPGSGSDWDPTHPVVQISWNDAKAYAAWVGGRLPTEAEWEHAARGGHGNVRFPWGDFEPDDTENWPCNIWQGRFPDVNSAADGYRTTAPAESFAANGYGLYNMSGNVWEWIADPFRVRSLKRAAKAKMAGMKGYRVLKGGSFLCHKSYCYRYRIAARTGNSPDSTTTHQGLRVVWDI